MNKERKEAEKVKNDMEDIQEILKQHAKDIHAGNTACMHMCSSRVPSRTSVFFLFFFFGSSEKNRKN